MKNKTWEKGIIISIILLLVGANFVSIAMSKTRETIPSENTSYNEDQLMPDSRYLIIGVITDIYEEEGLIKFTVVSAAFIKINPFTLKTYHSGIVEMKPFYVGLVMLHFICAIAQATVPTQNNDLSESPPSYDILPGKTPPEIIFGFINNLDTRGSTVNFTSAKRTWYIKWDYPFPTNLTIATFGNGIFIRVTPPLYFRIITPRFVFIIAYGITVNESI